MEQFIGKEITNDLERKKFLKDNADSVESLGYMKHLDDDQMRELKEDLLQIGIKLMDLKEEKKAYDARIMTEIKDFESQNKDILSKLKQRGEYVDEDCYKFIDYDNCQVGYYNDAGELVYHRPARKEEAQKTIISQIRRIDGTNN